LYNLILEAVQLASRDHEADDREGAREMKSLLARAEGLQTPTQSFHRLRARTEEWLGETQAAAADRRRPADPAVPPAALDHYLAGDGNRRESVRLSRDLPREGKQSGALAKRRQALLEAVASYREALRADPRHYWSHYQLGDCYLALGDHAAAAEALGTCVAL